MKAIIFILFLAGCATAPEIVKPKIVEVPVSIPCKIDIPEKPVWPTDGLSKDVSRSVWLRAALQELNLRIAYEFKLEAAALACVGG